MNNLHLTKIKQHFTNNSVTDLKGELGMELLKIAPMIKPGARIAIAAGSRGIRNLALIVREVSAFVKSKKAFPFIIPAMGSHGGATAEGQAEILAGYRITAETTGIPVISSMDVVELPSGDSRVPVFMDRNAFESDGVILINRIKPHTDYHSEYESGLVKMSVIGLGKEKQASAIHSYGIYGLRELIPMVAKEILSSGKIIGGVAVVENAYDETMCIRALGASEFFEKEPSLLRMASGNMPSLPADDIDVLIIDQMGKDISGVGIDTNIIGRIKIQGQEEPGKPSIKAIAVTDLTDSSHGNALGIGLSDVITRRLFDKIDFTSTYTNTITSSFIERAKIPVVAANDKEAFQIALRSCGYLKKGSEKIVRIRDTLHLDQLYVSEPVLDLIRDHDRIEIMGRNINMFSEDNDLIAF
jgi:hypothetical protein